MKISKEFSRREAYFPKRKRYKSQVYFILFWQCHEHSCRDCVTYTGGMPLTCSCTPRYAWSNNKDGFKRPCTLPPSMCGKSTSKLPCPFQGLQVKAGSQKISTNFCLHYLLEHHHRSRTSGQNCGDIPGTKLFPWASKGGNEVLRERLNFLTPSL